MTLAKTDELAFKQHQGKLLQKARKQAKLSQTDVASYFNMSQDSISMYEKGKVSVNSYQLLEFSRLYKKPITFFYMTDLLKLENGLS